MSRKSTPLTPGLAKLYDLIVSAGAPLSCAVIAERYGRTPDHVCTLLRRLRDRGLVAPTSSGRGAEWATTTIAKAAREWQLSAMPKSQRERQNHYQRQYRLRQRTGEAVNAWTDQPMRQAIIPAHLCAPIRPSGPVSVFHLAKAAAGRLLDGIEHNGFPS
jgi:hypothetical protein